jgi:hypothetical protein
MNFLEVPQVPPVEHIQRANLGYSRIMIEDGIMGNEYSGIELQTFSNQEEI